MQHEGDFTWPRLIQALDADGRTKIREYLEISLYGPATGLKERRLRQLVDAYDAGAVTLVLGAGVGVSAGLPSWDQLLSSLLLQALMSKIRRKLGEGTKPQFTIAADEMPPLLEVFDKALDETSPLLLSRFAQFEFDDNEDNPQHEPGAFMGRVGAILRQAKPPDSPLLRSLVRMVSSGGVRQIVTYNFDDLVDRALAAAGQPAVSLGPGADAFSAAGNEVPIYHVHGRFREDGTPVGIVFSEPDYHRQYGDPSSWSNVIQIDAFRGGTCVFVGHGLTDPNTRRLLEAARAERGEQVVSHFAFLRKTLADDVVRRLGATRTRSGQIVGDPAGQQLDEVHATVGLVCHLADAARDAALEALGVAIIWLDTFEELPGLLDYARTGDGDVTGVSRVIARTD